MKLKNPLEANDWDIGAFFKFIASLQLAVFIVLGLDAIGLHVPMLREVVTLIYLLFVPGVILLRVLRLHELNVIEGVLYAFGLSIATVMLTGLFMNTVYVYFITSQPLSLVPFITTMSVIVLVLCLASYWRDRNFSRPTTIDVHMPSSPLVPSLLLLPFVSILGAYVFNATGSSAGIVIVLLSVAALIIVCGFTRYVEKRYYPLVILAVSVALLLHNTLITSYLWGFDIQIEHYVAQFVANNGFWGAPPAFDRNTLNLNTMLSITMLAPLLSVATGMSLTWIFKLVFPLLYALVPLGLYRLYEKQTSPRIALFGVFYFMVTFSFYTEMVAMARQEIAEFFFVALLLLMVDRETDRTPRLFLFGLFGFSLIVSHYALTYIFLFCFILAWLILLVMQRFDVGALKQRITRTGGISPSTRRFFILRRPRSSNAGISAVFVVGFTLIAFVWYRFANNSQPFDSLARMIIMVLAYIGIRAPLRYLNGIPNSSDTPPLPTLTSRANGMDTTGFQTILAYKLPMHQVTQYLILIALLISIAGILFAFAYKNRLKLRLSNEYVAFSMASVVILYLCLVQPYFAASLNISRFYHITQIMLSVFFVIGFTGFFSVLGTRSTTGASRARGKLPLKALACFTVVLFLFNAGIVYKAAGELNDSSTVIALDKSVDYSKYNDQEIVAAKWIAAANPGNVICTDYFRLHAVYEYDKPDVRLLPKGGFWGGLPAGSYVYLGTPNVQTGKVVLGEDILSMLPTELDARYYVGGSSNVYSNGGAQIYLTNG